MRAQRATVPASRCAETPTPMPPCTMGSSRRPRMTSGGNPEVSTSKGRVVGIGLLRAPMRRRPGELNERNRSPLAKP